MKTDSLQDKALAHYGKVGIPYSAHFDLTYRCPLGCRHCYLSGVERPDMPTGQVFRILEELAQCGTLSLTLSGGEVFSRKDFPEILEKARELRFQIAVKTSGALATPRQLDALVRANPLRVDLSFYSHDPEIHDAVTRRPGSFEKSLEAFRAYQRDVSPKTSNQVAGSLRKNA